MNQQNLTLAKIPILNTGKFEQWQFRIQQYLQHEHYALWEVIEFENSYEAPAVNPTTSSASDGTGKKKGRTVTLTGEDMQKRKNDVKARTILLLSLPDEHQLRFSKYKTAQELWAAILKTFGDVEIKQDDLNQKLLTSLAPEWLMHTIVWRNRSDLDTMSLDDLYNHLKVYESEVQKKLEPNSQNMAFISSAKHNSGNEEINIVSVSTASTNVSTASVNIGVASISQDTACAYIGLPEAKTDEGETTTDKGLKRSYRNALMAKTSAKSEVFDSSLCSKDWLAQVKARLAEHRDRELKYCEKIRVLEFKTESGANCIECLTKDLELLKKEKGELETKLTGFQTASKDLDSLLKSQRLDKNKEGLGYSAVSSPPAQIYSPPKKDMSWTGLSEFKDDTVTDYSRPSPAIKITLDDAQNRNPSVTESEASPNTISPKSFIKFVKVNDSPTKSKKDKIETAKKPPVKYAEQYRKPTKKPNVRGNQRNWNNLKSYQLEKRPPMRPMRPNMNAAQPNRKSFNKPPAHSYTKRHFQRTSAVKSQYRALWVPTVNRNFPPVNRKFSTVSRNFSTVNRKFPTANRKFPTSGTKFSTADMGKKEKVVKPSACWFWKPSQNLSNKGPNSNSGSSQNNIDNKGYWDSGCSRHMTDNISYLSNYEPFDGGYVSFGQGGCKITGKGTIKTSKLEFENVYFVKDLKYNLFSVSQICDNKNSVFFTDSECIVLGQNFKLSDDDNVLLRTPRQHNMYSIDLNNIVAHKDLTCLVAKASADECMLWHMRLGDSLNLPDHMYDIYTVKQYKVGVAASFQ
nr:ribonuclease H-like domain-containing protein [Tanacetum cinerariifolium]